MTYFRLTHIKLRPVHIGHWLGCEFLLYTSLFIAPLETVVNTLLDDYRLMESFSVIWCSFLLVNVQFLVWKVGEYLLLIMRIFVLFKNVLFQQLQLPYSLYSYICWPKSKRKTVSYARFIITATDKIRVK